MLSIKNLTKVFDGKKVLNNVSLNVRPGAITVLLGSSGVGKSTLLRVLNNLESIDTGTVELDGKLLDLTSVNINHMVGMVFQHFNLFEHWTVLENITIPLVTTTGTTPEKAQQIARQLLERYGLADKQHIYPGRLSGGQKQRLALARTIALKPRVICMDEPTSALDPLLTSHVAQTISQLANEGYIILIATHDTTLLEKLDCTICLMRDGKIIEQVQSSDFFAQRSSYPALDAFVSGTLPESID